MFLKKNIKILVLCLSFAILPVTIKGMEKEPNKIIYSKNSRKNKKLLKKLKKEITELKNKNIEMKPNENIKHKLKDKELSKKITKIAELENRNIKTRSNKTPDNLFFIKDQKLLNEIKTEINEIEDKIFENITRENAKFKISILGADRENLEELKEKTNDENIKNEIKDLIARSSSLIVILCRKSIDILEKEILDKKDNENMNTSIIDSYIKRLKEYKEKLIETKGKTSNKDLINNIDDLMNKISSVLENLFKEIIKIVLNKINNLLYDKNKDWNFLTFDTKLYFLENIEEEITNFIKENSNIKNVEILNNAKIIDDLIIKIYEKYITNLKETRFDDMVKFEIDGNIKLLNKGEKTLTYLKDKPTNLENKDRINKLIDDISSLIVEINKLKK